MFRKSVAEKFVPISSEIRTPDRAIYPIDGKKKKKRKKVEKEEKKHSTPVKIGFGDASPSFFIGQRASSKMKYGFDRMN